MPSLQAPLPPESQLGATISGIFEWVCSSLINACTFAESAPMKRAPPMWYFARISALVSWLPLKASSPKKNRLVNSWPTFSSSDMAAMVCSTQAICPSSSVYGLAVRSTSVGMGSLLREQWWWTVAELVEATV